MFAGRSVGANLLKSFSRQEIAEGEGIAPDNFAEGEVYGAREDGAVEGKGVEFAVFAAGIDARREIGKEGFVQLAPGEAWIEDPGIDTDGDGAKLRGMEFADEFTRVAFPDGKEGLHRDSGEIFLAVEAEVFEEDVAEGDAADPLFEIEEQRFFHAGFVAWIDTLRRDGSFVQRQGDRFRLS